MPDLVTTCTMPPVARPNSALYCTLLTLNSSTASSGRFWRGSPSSAKLLMTPSTRLPVELNVTEPPTLTVAKKARVESMLVPGISSASDRYCRELIGSVSICCCVTTPETSDLVVSTTGALPVTVTVSATRLHLHGEVLHQAKTDRDLDIARTSTVAKPDELRRRRVSARDSRPESGSVPSVSVTVVRATPVA